MNVKKQILFVTLSVAICVVCNGQLMTDQFQLVLDSAFQAKPEAIGIMVHVEYPEREVSWSSAVGHADKSSQDIVLATQPALIASNTKTYVSAALLKLVELNKIELDQSIAKLISRKTRRKLKQCGYDLNKISVRNLLSHTSGITDYVNDEYFDFVKENPQHQWTRDEQIDLACELAKPKDVGKFYAYADINYLLLTEILEKRTNLPFYEAIRKVLDFEGNGLHETWFLNLEKHPLNMRAFVHQYSSKFNFDSYDLNPSWDLYGGGGLASTTKDLALFFQLLFTGRIIENAELLAEMYTYVIPREECKNYCLGVFNIPSFFGNQVYYHGGFWGTDVIYSPDYNVAISVFILQKEQRDISGPLANELLKLIKAQVHPNE